MIKKREWEAEDLDHIDGIIGMELSNGVVSLPGLESARDQIAIRLGVDTKYENHDKPSHMRHTS